MSFAVRLGLRLCLAQYLLAASLWAHPAAADVVLIANARNGVDHLTRDEAVNIFMGRYRKFPDGSIAAPLDLEAESPVRRTFYRLLLDKSLEEVNSYWVRLLFSGGTQPPAEIRGQDEVIERVAADPHAIGYVDRALFARNERSAPARGVKVLLSLSE